MFEELPPSHHLTQLLLLGLTSTQLTGSGHWTYECNAAPQHMEVSFTFIVSNSYCLCLALYSYRYPPPPTLKTCVCLCVDMPESQEPVCVCVCVLSGWGIQIYHLTETLSITSFGYIANHISSSSWMLGRFSSILEFYVSSNFTHTTVTLKYTWICFKNLYSLIQIVVMNLSLMFSCGKKQMLTDDMMNQPVGIQHFYSWFSV